MIVDPIPFAGAGFAAVVQYEWPGVSRKLRVKSLKRLPERALADTGRAGQNTQTSGRPVHDRKYIKWANGKGTGYRDKSPAKNAGLGNSGNSELLAGQSVSKAHNILRLTA
jgi:hypothetical protein